MLIKYLTSQLEDGQKLTEVIIPVWPLNIAIGAPVSKYQTRNIRSSDPAARRVFSKFIAMSVISEEAPRNVDRRRPVIEDHNFMSRSSAP